MIGARLAPYSATRGTAGSETVTVDGRIPLTGTRNRLRVPPLPRCFRVNPFPPRPPFATRAVKTALSLVTQARAWKVCECVGLDRHRYRLWRLCVEKLVVHVQCGRAANLDDARVARWHCQRTLAAVDEMGEIVVE